MLRTRLCVGLKQTSSTPSIRAWNDAHTHTYTHTHITIFNIKTRTKPPFLHVCIRTYTYIYYRYCILKCHACSLWQRYLSGVRATARTTTARETLENFRVNFREAETEREGENESEAISARYFAFPHTRQLYETALCTPTTLQHPAIFPFYSLPRCNVRDFNIGATMFHNGISLVVE